MMDNTNVNQSNYTYEEKLEIFSSCSFLSREHLVEDVKSEMADIAQQLSGANIAMSRYLSNKIRFLASFIDQMCHTAMFEKLEPWWAYQYVVSSRGIVLELVHYDYKKVAIISDESYFGIPNTTYTVLNIPAKTMTIEEYAEYTGKTEASIRQSLRRGKYRSAFKVGQEWRISELCEPNAKRGYELGQYVWETSLSDVPDAFEYIREPGFADITQGTDDKNSFILYVSHYGEPGGHFHTLNRVEMERLEHYLIANPLVVNKNDEKTYDKRRVKNLISSKL